ncbi:hypothetical protein ATI61_110217 [Archangium gephyra]|uniref:Lipoprotein n=1 Tax=Archangium gephyra TaxID=48 RepID=A0AAC8QEQ5_9BACT|nr:hypothetical protein [Archangium gephyra]AKJ06039.1 Hypothetical protein AA314_07665 [Archangium gephyra]REG27210.1 hypothetical protein ATI61_110217 [Archangium gephyra]
MKLQKTIRSFTCSLMSGLLLAACGGASEDALAPAEEQLGTRESAMCVDLDVSMLTIDGVSSYEGVAAGAGQWAVSTGANGVRMEFSVDGVLRSSTEYLGTSGTWNFSAGSMGCGNHLLEVKAFPMVVDSAGNRTTCYDFPMTDERGFSQYCNPTTSLSCTRVSTYSVKCTGSVSLGTGTHTAYWQTSSLSEDSSGWYQGTLSRNVGCEQRTTYNKDRPLDTLVVEFKVQDSNGNWSDISSRSLSCVAAY